jgi:hypothetical protein
VWKTLGTPRGGITTDNPAAVSFAPGRLDVFVRGTDNALWHNFIDQTGPHPWEQFALPLNPGPISLTSGPAVSSSGPNRLDIFVRGSDNAVWHTWFDGQEHIWEPLGGVIVSNPAAASFTPNRLDVFVRGADNGLYHNWFP